MTKHSLTNNGRQTVNTDYQLLCTNDTTWLRTGDNNLNNVMWKNLWKLKMPYKLVMFLWKILNDSLPVRIELTERNVKIEYNCAMCDGEEETTNHLFTQFAFARAVWFGSELTILTDALGQQSIKCLLTQWLTNREIMLNEIGWFNTRLVTTLWCIWKSRNDVVFNKGKVNPISAIYQQKKITKWVLKTTDMGWIMGTYTFINHTKE